MLEILNNLAVSFDLPILDWIQANLQSGFMDTIWPIITMFGDGGIFWIAISGFLGISAVIGIALFLLLAGMMQSAENAERAKQ